MPNKNTLLLNPTERLDIYGIPALNDAERREYFTFNEQETKKMNSFQAIEDTVYFAVCLAFFKIKQTLVNFNYRDITSERQHVMERYFPNQPFPKSLPKNYNKIARIENKVLELCHAQRFTGDMVNTIKEELLALAPRHPRQRQLCKALLNLFVTHRVSIPAYTTIQTIISHVWNKENNRVTQAYLRYTHKNERDIVLSLLDKTDNLHRIVSIKQSMKGFNTTELNNEIEKHHQIKPIFDIAKNIIPRLGLPTTTINYYATLIHYYNGPRLKQLHTYTIQLYLLCYSFTRFQMLNDNLLEALKKRTLEYQSKAVEYAKNQALDQMDLIKDTRKKVSDLLIAIKHHPNPTHIPREIIYQYVPENELLTAAKLLVDDNFNKELLFWKYIDSVEDPIKLNLRQLFLTIDFVIIHDELLKEVVTYTKTALINNTFYNAPLPPNIKAWINKSDREYIMPNDTVIYNRFEFLLYKMMAYHITTNKLTLKYSIKYKKVEDDLMSPTTWNKKKPYILKKLGYDKLNVPIQHTLKTKQHNLTELYHTVNQAILKGENEQIKISKDQNGKPTWRLRPLTEDSDPNDSLFANFQQRSIVDVIQFVNNRTHFTKVFEAILPRATKNKQDQEFIMAVVLANAIRLGARKMASISDLNESELLTAEASFVRTETLLAATDLINNAAAEFPIYKKWYINSIMHASLDGLKLETSFRNIKARHSKKYFGRGIGVSGYNEIFNCFSLAGRLIGTNEYEGNFSFEMVHHQNTSEIKPDHISTDKHGTNAFNFGLFDLTDLVFAPRIPKPHRQIFWGFGDAKDYDGLIIKPTKFINENFLVNEWDNIQCLVSSLLAGEGSPSILISKLSSKNYRSDTKKAFVEYNHIVRSQFLLEYLHDPAFRRAILIALNRGEAFNNLYRAITVLNKGELRGLNEIEMEIWNQCTRLISSIILYYNIYILNSLYQSTHDEVEKAFLISLSPGAWVHINMLGYYQFYRKFSGEWLDHWIKQWNWRQSI